MFLKTGSYVVNTLVVSNNNDKQTENHKNYTYDEAVNLTGQGPYSLLLLFTGCFAILGLTSDLFSFSSVVSAAACDLQLDMRKEKVLFSVPFIGVIASAYPWGYVSDTWGRRSAMLVATWTSFIASLLASFSPHWILIAILKVISTSCSSCTLSITYTLVGETCSAKAKSIYFYILICFAHVASPYQMVFHYITINMDFSLDMGLITFVPWRFLSIMLALPLGCSAIALHFIYESPKFLLNCGKEEEALEILTKIWKRNRQHGAYPVKKIILTEERSTRSPDESMLQSLWNQVVPLFKKPMLLRSLQLYYLVLVVYGTCGGLLVWFVFITDAFISGKLSDQNSTKGFCNIITQYSAAAKDNGHNEKTCVPKSDMLLVWASIIQAVVLSFITCAVSFASGYRKTSITLILLISTLASLGCAVLAINITSLVSYFTIFILITAIAIVMSYFVDLYPTSHRGMASCLSIMFARFANLIAVNVIGSNFEEHCQATFYTISAILFSAVVVACFLPSDKQKRQNA